MTAGGPLGGRSLALGLLALAMLALWAGPVSADFGLIGSSSEQLAQQARLLQRYRALASLPPAAAVAAASPGAAGLTLPPVPEAQAVALLQESVKKAASASQVEIRSLQVLRRDTLSGAARIGVRVSAAGDTGSLGRFLFAIEAARPLMYVDNLQVQAHPALPGTATKALDFQLDMSSFAASAAR